MAKLWGLLSQTWGARFIDQYGPNPNEAWQGVLAQTDLDAARDALRALIYAGSPFPPTLPEFLAEARKSVRERIKREQNAEVLRIGQRGDPETARKNIDQIRAMLKGIA
jgi:hypothetical protein